MIGPPTQTSTQAGNPRDEGVLIAKQNNESQALANAAMAGGKHRKRKIHRGGDIEVTTLETAYPSSSGDGAAAQQQALYANSSQGAANAKLDQLGGRKTRRTRGGNPADVKWGCSSGGRKKYTKKRKSSRKKRKSSRKKRKSSRKSRR